MTKNNSQQNKLKCAEITSNIAYVKFERDCKLSSLMFILLIFLVGFARTFMLMPSLVQYWFRVLSEDMVKIVFNTVEFV